MPSLSSVVGSLVVVLGIIGFHLLLLSGQSELFLPHVTGNSSDQLARIYEANILKPLNSLFGSSLLGVASTALVWGLVGWIIYALLDFAVNSVQEWRRSESDINLPAKNRVILHPMHGQVVIRVLWRFLLGVIAVGSIIAFQPIVSALLNRDIEILRSASSVEMLKHIGITVVSWLAIMHFYVVLFRLFVFRTRVFGEIIY